MGPGWQELFLSCDQIGGGEWAVEWQVEWEVAVISGKPTTHCSLATAHSPLAGERVRKGAS